jgi:small conductance mechanosensitive channel
MDAFWQELHQWAGTYAGRVVGAAALLVVGVLALRYTVAPLRRLLERGQVQAASASFVVNSARGLLLVAIVLGVLQQLGVATASLLTVLAAGGVAVALSLQSTLANFTSGLLLLSFRMVRVGDLIESGSFRGRVSEIFPFHIVLITEDNQVVTVPNSALTGNGFRNLSARPTRRAQWVLPLKPEDNLDAVKGALTARLLTDPRVLHEPPPRAFVQEWADDKRMLAVQAWCATADYPAVQEELLEALGLAAEGVRPARGEATEAPSP